MESVDPGRKYARHRIFRDVCLSTDYAYIKDLNILGRDLAKTLIIENTLNAFAYQPENGILVKTFEGDEKDDCLQKLGELLLRIKDENDLREALKNERI